MSDQTNAVQGGIKTGNHISYLYLYLFLFFNYVFFVLLADNTAVFIFCFKICILLFPPYVNIVTDITSVQSGSLVAGNRHS